MRRMRRDGERGRCARAVLLVSERASHESAVSRDRDRRSWSAAPLSSGEDAQTTSGRSAAQGQTTRPAEFQADDATSSTEARAQGLTVRREYEPGGGGSADGASAQENAGRLRSLDRTVSATHHADAITDRRRSWCGIRLISSDRL
jgi:hypothetical protein